MPKIPLPILLAMLLIDTSPSFAADLPTAASATIRGICQLQAILDPPAFGDLNGDGVADAAALIACSQPYVSEQLVVLLGTKQGTYRVLDRSSDLVLHERRWDRVEIRKGVLVLSQGCAAACNSSWKRSFTFKYMNGRMKLIGEDTTNYEMDMAAGPDEGVDYVNNYGSSINYLTGRSAHWREAKKRNIKRTRQAAFDPKDDVLLEGFEPDRAAKGIHGYLDKNFSLHIEGEK